MQALVFRLISGTHLYNVCICNTGAFFLHITKCWDKYGKKIMCYGVDLGKYGEPMLIVL